MPESTPRLSQDIFDILYRSDVGIAICDSDGRFVWGNPQYQKLSGIDIHTDVGQHILDLQAGHEINVYGADNMLSIVLEKKESLTSMVDFNTGSKHDIIVTATPMFNADGSLRWIMYSLADCDGLLTIQKELAEVTERLEAGREQLFELMLENGGISSQCVIHDKKMQDLYGMAFRVAKVPATVLILGETGTGKDYFARFIHNSSPRRDKPFVHVNCSAIPENLFEAELFGYEAGSFTGASRQGKIGLIEYASTGTLYLDEIAEMPLVMQTKLLGVLQHKEITRIGGVKAKPVDIRVIAATNRDLSKMMKDGTFREDLYYRLNVIELQLPPLRERRDDIIPLIDAFTRRFNDEYQQNKKFSMHALQLMSMYDWPGNVRELEHAVERLVIMSPEDFIGADDLPLDIKLPMSEGKTLKELLDAYEEKILRDTIVSTESLKEAADRLGIELSTLTRKKQKFNIYLKSKEKAERKLVC